jgi:tetratricopeptide (TPR) repeat protein
VKEVYSFRENKTFVQFCLLKKVGGFVLRSILIFFLLLSPVYSYSWYGDDEDDDFEYDEPSRLPRPVAYGGMTITCDNGCGDFTSNQRFQEMSVILGETVRKVFSKPCSPLYLGWPPLIESKAFPFHAWIREWPFKYRVYDWERTKGFYLYDAPRKEYQFTSYPQFLELAAALRRDARFYSLGVYEQELKFFRNTLSRVLKIRREGKYGNIAFEEDGQLELYGWGSSTSRSKEIDDFIQRLKWKIKDGEERISDLHPSDYEKNRDVVEQAIQKVDGLFRSIFARCLERHQAEGIAFHGALEGLIGQDYYQAIDQIRWLIETAEKHNVQDELMAKLYLLQGEVQSEYGLYAEAVVGLTTAIQKDPKMKEAYFERAAAYFELGQFDQAIEDYLTSNLRPTYFTDSTQLALGISAGILMGAKDSTLEFIPTMLGTAQGLGAGIWALLKSPVDTSQEFVNAAVQCVEYIRSHSTFEVVQGMVPELRELIQNYEHLENFQKGRLIGQVVGKYGMDILLAKQSVAFFKAYQNLKKANKALTLDALASSEKVGPLLAGTEKRWSNIHIEAIRKGEVKIVADKQGKHIAGHHNYEDKYRSILTHPDPQKLLTEYGGTGFKAHDSLEAISGVAGYKEVVDFKQVIGYAVDRETKEKTATTLGKIHYAKNGAHIVPFVKK